MGDPAVCFLDAAEQSLLDRLTARLGSGSTEYSTLLLASIDRGPAYPRLRLEADQVPGVRIEYIGFEKAGSEGDLYPRTRHWWNVAGLYTASASVLGVDTYSALLRQGNKNAYALLRRLKRELLSYVPVVVDADEAILMVDVPSGGLIPAYVSESLLEFYLLLHYTILTMERYT